MRAPVVLLFALASSTAAAGEPIRSSGNFGLGIGSGTHSSGLSMKYYAADNHAFQGVVGWWGLGRGADNDGIGASFDYLIEGPALAHGDGLEIGWNIGPGVNTVITDNKGAALGVNGVLGLEFNIDPVPLDVVLEYRPGLRVVPDLEADFVGFGAHIRVYPF
ncbi:MAG: hypothetical protein EP330_21220 [Deltaproteobacteria bacterium]|nr:MAG: hypothetical protein EP330_21220 [Deltaproteobacteria bacterium]